MGNNSGNNSGPDDTNIFEDETYDPVVAQRFELLKRATPPAVEPASPEAAPGVDATSGSDRRRFLLATAAAAALLVAAVAAFVVAGNGDSVEVAGDVDSSEEAADGVGDESDQDAVPTTVPPPDADGSTTTAMLVSTDSVETASSAETSPDETSVPTEPPETSETTSAENPPTNPETTIPADGDLVTIRGVITEVMLDCNSHLILKDNGEVEQSDAIMCDGGNFIVVDGNQISTTSGFVPADMAFNNHPDWIKPGLQVTVTAFRERAGWLHLNCDECRIRRG